MANKMDKKKNPSWVQLRRMKRKRVKLNKIRNEEGRHTNITTDTGEIKNNYERILYATLWKPQGDGQFPTNSKLPKSAQEKMENFNRPITVEEIRRRLEVYQWKAPESGSLTAELYLISNERIIPVLFELFGGIETDRRETSSFILRTQNYFNTNDTK